MVKVLIYPDSHGDIPAFKLGKVDFAISPGDFCSSGTRKYEFQAICEWKSGKGRRNWFDIAGKKKVKKEIEKSLRDGKKLLERLNVHTLSQISLK